MPNDAWNSGLRVNIVNTLDTSKIQKLAKQAQVSILVGFLSGREHVPTFHKNDKGEYKTYDGQDIENAEPIDTAELAKELHYGTATIPARPFLEDGIRSKEKDLEKAMAEEVTKIKDGGQANWKKIGTMAVGAVQELVRSDFYKTRIPNSKKTQDYKGSDTPLIDGGDLMGSLTFLVNGVEGK
jgi:hypothetical protein